MADNKKSLADRYEDEQLTDNKALKPYQQCKDCIFRDGGTPFSDDYRKGCCSIYQYPDNKPHGVFTGAEDCEYYEKD